MYFAFNLWYSSVAEYAETERSYIDPTSVRTIRLLLAANQSKIFRDEREVGIDR